MGKIKKKICNKCGEEKPLDDFSKNLSSKDGYFSDCKLCKKEYDKKYHSMSEIEKKEYVQSKRDAKLIKAKKICTKCSIEKELKLFNKSNKMIDGYRSICKDCQKIEAKIYREKIKLENPNHYKEYYQKNKEKESTRKKMAYEKSPYFYIWRSILKASLKRLGCAKEESTIELLGYSAIELKRHIESLFTEGMSWDNYGEWHIDHVIPIVAFDKNTLPSVVNALSNLQPLWATSRIINEAFYMGNLNKGSKLIYR